MNPYQNISDRAWLKLLSEPRDGVPPLPPTPIQERFCGRAGRSAMEQALEFYKVIRSAAEKADRPLSSMKAVLDFGCGWGRITRCFLRDLEPETLQGTDCDPEMVDYCSSVMPGHRFSCNPPLPPSSFADGQFDLIYAYSVFSHLSEAAHRAWLGEFHRIMKPGALLIVTTRPRYFVAYWPRLPYLPEFDVKKCLTDYDAGKFVHIPAQGGTATPASFYGETGIPESYVRREWSKWFDVQQFHDHVPEVDQKVIVVRR